MTKKDKLGVALVKELCFLCAKEIDGPIVLNTRLTVDEANKVKELHGKVVGWSDKPCEECQKGLDVGFMFIGFDESKSDMENFPEDMYRSGHIIVTKRDIPLVQEFVKEHSPLAIEKGYIFMPHVVMIKLGLIEE